MLHKSPETPFEQIQEFVLKICHNTSKNENKTKREWIEEKKFI